MLEILLPGIQTSIQSTPRIKALAKGISVGGAADAFSAKLANILLKQDVELPVLELVSSPFSARVIQDCIISFSGAAMLWKDETNTVFSNGSVAHLQKGSTLVGIPAKPGYRAYLGILSGFNAKLFEGSYSTDLRLKNGGMEGPLKNGSVLIPKNVFQSEDQLAQLIKANWHLDEQLFSFIRQSTIRLIPSFEHDLFPQSEIETFTQTAWQISSQSNRMGIRLSGKEAPTFARQKLYSSTVLPGTVQITPDGPIILMQDAHTAGGYPRIGQVFEADLPTLAQKAPAEVIEFSFGTIENALSQKKNQQMVLKQISRAIQYKYTTGL